MTLVAGKKESPFIEFKNKENQRTSILKANTNSLYTSIGLHANGELRGTSLKIGNTTLNETELQHLKRLISALDYDASKSKLYTNKHIHIDGKQLYVTGWGGWSNYDLARYPAKTVVYPGANENGHIYAATRHNGSDTKQHHISRGANTRDRSV
jgi:hypothetical protein